jgi:NAD+ synthase (glutamine-hydrolysing)
VTISERHNAASVICNGQVAATYAKQRLPNYQVFDERRYFVPGQGACVFDAGGVRVGLLICEDAWYAEPARQAKAAGPSCWRSSTPRRFTRARAPSARP